MIYKFPQLEHIDQVLPFIKDAPEFGVHEKDGGYTVIAYHVTTPETFPDDNPELSAIRRECRGIVFNTKTGKILSRPYHKFFNLNERAETQMSAVPFHMGHILLEKLDGSMIRPLFLDSGLRWGTKAGITDVSMQAECWIQEHPEYIEAASLAFYSAKMTPLFEWCSRLQKIVLDYPKDRLVLTGLRDNRTGEYASYPVLIDFAEHSKIDLVNEIGHDYKELEKLAENVADMENTEGYVLRFDSGHMLKIKCTWYVNLHRAKEALMQERHLVGMILDEKLDDILAALPKEDQAAIETYKRVFWSGVDMITAQLAMCYYAWKDRSRKEFALGYHESDPLFKSLIFKQFDGKNAREELLKAIRNGLGSNQRFETVRSLFGSPAPWKGLMNGQPEDSET